MALFKPNEILEYLPNNFYIIDTQSFRIINSNNPDVAEEETTCYQFIYGFSEPCYKKGYNCICKKVVEARKPLEIKDNLPENLSNKFAKVLASPIFGEKNEVTHCAVEYIDHTEDVEQKLLLQKEIEANRALTEEYITANEELVKANTLVTESEARFKALFEHSGTANAYFTIEGELVLQNSLSEKFLGKNIGQNFKKLIPEIFGQETGSQFIEKFREVTEVKYEISFQSKINLSGKEFWLVIELVPVFDNQELLAGIQTITKDVTELKKTEKELKESTEKYKRLVESSPDIIYIVSLRNGPIYLSPGVNDILDTEKRADTFKLINWSQAVLPEDRHILQKIFRSINNRINYDVEYRIIDSNKNIRWFRDRSFSIKPKSSDYIIEGTISDITQRKQTEFQLKESQVRYKSLFENINNGVIVFRETGKNEFEIINLNRSAESIFCIQKEKVKGQNISDAIPGIKETFLFPSLNKVSKTGNPVYLPSYVYENNDAPVWVETYLYRLPNNDIVATFRNLTNEIIQKKEIKISQKRLLRAEKLAKTGNWEFNLINKEVIASEGAIGIYELEHRPYTISDIQKYPLPNYREMLDESLDALIKEGKPYDIEFEIKTSREGKIKWIRSIAEYSKNKNLVFGTINDITELKLIQKEIQLKNEEFQSMNEELEENFAKLQHLNAELEEEKDKVEENEKILLSIFNHSPVIMLLLDNHAKIIKVNQYGLDYTGSRALEMTGKGVGNLFNCIQSINNFNECGNGALCAKCPVRNIILRTLNSGEEKYKEECEITSGLLSGGHKTYTILVSTSLFERKGKKNLLVTLDDITDRKKMESVLLEAKLKAQESDRLKTAFLANMSHEIRTPLNGLLGFTNIICSGNYPSEQLDDYRRIVENCGSRLLTVVNDILDISMLQANQLKIHPEKVNISELLDELYILYEKNLAEGSPINLILSKSNADDCHIEIETDKNRLFQIFKNLLDNAFKFTHTGEIEFGCIPGKPDLITFFVKDTGIGIAGDKLGSIFEPFRQADETWSKPFGGTGLGLSIASQLISLLGGKIWVDTELGKGSTFYFNLPATGLTGINKEVKNKTANYLSALQGKKIAVIEDDYESFLLIRFLFEKWKTGWIYFDNAEDFIQYIMENNADLVLMDARLPGMSGYEAAQISKQLKPGIPVLMQTAYAMPGDHRKALDAGCDDYISKPVDQELLAKKIINLLTKQTP